VPAQEIIRRCGRRIGELIREGQAAGTITSQTATRRDNLAQNTAHAHGNVRSKPTDYLHETTLSKTVYPLTDRLTAEEFEAALDEVRAERNLSARNMARKVGKGGGWSGQ
jgi:hypothetical protein